MNQEPVITDEKQAVWLRALYMLLMAMIFQVAGTLLFIIAVIQFVLAAVNDAPNTRLRSFGQSLATYLAQIAAYLSFASEKIPFPFSDWPAPD